MASTGDQLAQRLQVSFSDECPEMGSSHENHL
ncbi:hypothetical protein A2U01_0098796, partial [Trifolium medium]|nr:hypothetical protein [Trifolium medium]